MSNKLYILCGIPFSGKTTLAKRMVDKFGFTRIDLDEVKFDLFGSSITDSEIDKSGWDKVYQVMYKEIRDSLKQGKTVINDTGNFTRNERNIVKKIADDLGIESVTIFVDTPEEEAHKRLIKNRENKVRFDVIDDDFSSTVSEMEKPENDEKHIIYNWADDFDLWANNKFSLNIIVVVDLSEEQKKDVSALQNLAFTGVSNEEAAEDFYNPEIANVLAYLDKKLVGWAGVHRSDVIFEGRPIKLGGYGICTHPNHQGRGIASLVSAEAMNYLKENGVEVAFLSVDPSSISSVKLHKKNGFVEFPRMFSWINSKGETKQDDGGMIALVNSKELFEYVLNGKEKLFVGNGYW